MNEKDTTLVIELLVNQVLHLRSQVELLQEQLDKLGVLSHRVLDRDVEEHWTQHGDKAVDAFWNEFHKLRRASG